MNGKVYKISLIMLCTVLMGPIIVCGGSPKKEINFRAMYGVNIDTNALNNRDMADIIKKFKTNGINAFFINYRDKKLIEALHKENLFVFIEVSVFVGEKYWKKDPKTKPVNSKGKQISKIKWYAGVCPNRDWVIEEKLTHIKNLITNYNIDGIWLDFIRYPCHWEVAEPILEQTCFCDQCLNGFQNELKIKIPENMSTTEDKATWILNEHNDEWTKWKCRRITAFVEKVRGIIKDTNPNVLLGIFTVPWKNAEYNNAIETIICQDYVDLAQYVDIFSPMAYHQMCKKPVSWIADITDYISNITGKKVMPIIQTNDINRDEFGAMMETVLTGRAEGVIIFNSGNFEKEKMITIINDKLMNEQ